MRDDQNTKDLKKGEEKNDNKQEDRDLEELKKKDCSKKCQGLEEKITEFENKYKRALADYQNLEKRTIDERREWIRISNKELILRLLPVLDTLRLVNKHVSDQGLKLAIQQFLDILETEGVVKIETLGKDFNPQEMECIQTKTGEEGKVLEELRAGYKLNDKILRASQVIVGEKAVD